MLFNPDSIHSLDQIKLFEAQFAPNSADIEKETQTRLTGVSD